MDTNETKLSCMSLKKSFNKFQDKEGVKEEELVEEREIKAKGAYLTWSDLNAYAPTKTVCTKCLGSNIKNYKQILTDGSGSAKPGTMMAIMGSSGSGKTTTLNLLSGNISSSLKYRGDIKLNGKSVNIKKYSAFIQQENLFFNNVTVIEHMRMHADLRMGRKFSRKEKEEKIELLLHKFGLSKLKNSIITKLGSKTKGISGGEKKRLSIITELFTDPHVLFFDEPTSGLDSYIAKSVIKLIKEIADSGKTIICTIHQPSNDSIVMFTEIILLYRGNMAISGTIDRALEYYKEKGFPCPTNCNPADHLINMVSLDIENEDESHNQIMGLLENDNNIKFYTEEELPNTVEELVSVQAKTWFGSYRANEFVQFKHLFLRGFLTTLRQPVILGARIGMEMFLGFIIGALYLRPPLDTNNIQNFVGLIFFECAGLTLNGVLASTLSFPDEIKIFMNEHRSNLYRTSVYFIAKTLSELPYHLIQNILTVILIYTLIGLRPNVWAFFLHYIVVVLMYQCAISYGYLASSFSNSAITALAVASPLLVPLIIFGSFLITESQIPIFLRWIRYIAWYPYANDGLLAINFKDVNLKCVGGLFCPFPNLTPEVSAEDFLKVLGIRFSTFGRNIGSLFFLILMYRGLAAIIIIVRVVLKNRGML